MADTNLQSIVFNKLSKAKYEELKAAGQLNANEFYITPDESITESVFEEKVAEINEAVATKANSADVYTKSDVDGKVTEINEAIATKANSADVYTKSAVDSALALKADKTALDEAVAGLEEKITAKDSLPAQADQAGKFLTTNGTAASWTELPTATTAQAGIVQLASADDLTSETTAVTPAIMSSSLNTLSTSVDNALATKANSADVYTKSETYSKSEVDGLIASTFHYKGSVATEAELPTENNTIGDVYNVEATGDNYAWDGAAWDKLAGTVDLSGYYTKSEVDSALALKADQTSLESAVATINESIATKADAQSTADALALKADTATVDSALALKADQATTYTKDEVDTAIEDRVVAIIRTWE